MMLRAAEGVLHIFSTYVWVAHSIPLLKKLITEAQVNWFVSMLFTLYYTVCTFFSLPIFWLLCLLCPVLWYAELSALVSGEQYARFSAAINEFMIESDEFIVKPLTYALNDSSINNDSLPDIFDRFKVFDLLFAMFAPICFVAYQFPTLTRTAWVWIYFFVCFVPYGSAILWVGFFFVNGYMRTNPYVMLASTMWLLARPYIGISIINSIFAIFRPRDIIRRAWADPDVVEEVMQIMGVPLQNMRQLYNLGRMNLSQLRSLQALVNEYMQAHQSDAAPNTSAPGLSDTQSNPPRNDVASSTEAHSHGGIDDSGYAQESCTICYQNVPAIEFLPCKHCILCHDCFEGREAWIGRRCHLCDLHVMDVKERRSPWSTRAYLSQAEYQQESTYYTAQHVAQLVAQVQRFPNVLDRVSAHAREIFVRDYLTQT